ncbi:MAG: ABC transporter permease [Hyphomicrobiales bacterium]|nr:ABC transporter permease [Hyphomicrobiales bacterium]
MTDTIITNTPKTGASKGSASMSDQSKSRRSLWRAAVVLIIAACCYEAAARSGYFAPALMPKLSLVAQTFVAMLLDGTMIEHSVFTLYRVMFGFLLAVLVGLPIGILMARFAAVEGFFLPLVSALMPIPSFALVPLFMLWFGIGNLTTILIVFYAATFPMMFNTWSGVRSVNPLWLRAAGAMGADENALFWKVIIPGASPFIITGLRQAFLRAWIAVVGAEMIAASDWGLGWVIFDAKEFLNTDVMLAALVVIGGIGFVFEKMVFGSLEKATIQRWGMSRVAKG